MSVTEQKSPTSGEMLGILLVIGLWVAVKGLVGREGTSMMGKRDARF
jgi:hypothetical protein